MAQQAVSIATRHTKPPMFNGTDAAWRVLCDLYPAAETPEIILAVIEYCAVRKLDPFKRPVHIVPMYNSRLRRKVQVVMQGINEVEITASRTGQWAGLDAPVWGPVIERTFRGSFENDDGSTQNTEVTMRFPSWCMLTVWRQPKGGEKRGFTEQLFWEECYARVGFRSEVPNQRWQQNPRQMLHKCTKAAVLRAAFPEEGFDYVAEEMEGRETEGGITIDGAAQQVDRRDRPDSDTDRRAAATYQTASDTAGLGRLETEANGTKWLALFLDLVRKAQDLGRLHDIASHRRVREQLQNAPTLIRAQINDALREAHERLAPTGDDDAEGMTDDPLAERLAEVAEMDLITIAGLASNAQWRAKVRDMFPPDEDRLNEAIAARKAVLERTPQ
jgi:phage recombination protein Bet